MLDQIDYKRKKDGSKISMIKVDRDLCIGASPCVAVSAETFQLDDENKAIVLDANAADDDTLTMAAQSCPTGAILLFDEDGKQVYP